MKSLLLILILTFSFQSLTKADDIKDFEIEGMSVGDSALNFYSKNEIESNTRDYYKNKKFTPAQLNNFPFYKTYESVDIEFKTNDNKYIIHSLSGIIKYENKNIKNCYEKMEKIDENLSRVLKNFKREGKATWKHGSDPTGKSTFTDIYYESIDGTITLTCYDFSKEAEETGSRDYLSLMISLNEWNTFMRSNPYQ
tara:strand:+ start:271 stop:858 length:588 start_codon:yes stop_codon:yes gene_type:complete